jgi:hypothetical protein
MYKKKEGVIYTDKNKKLPLEKKRPEWQEKK